jgi:pimeloyl-ACP methyl ester carboxylesterase
MDAIQKRSLVAGMAVAAAAVAGTALLRRCNQQRLKLASQVHNVTQRAVERLGVQATSQFIQVGNMKLHTVVAGPEDGPLVLLLHGFPECWYSWRAQIPILAQIGYCVVVPDQRGYNLSDQPRGVHNYQIDHLTADVMGLIHALGRERAVIVAHTWGGVAAWRFAMDYPDSIEKLVIMNAPHPVPFAKALNSDWSQRFRSWYMGCFQLPWLPEALLTLSPSATARLFFRRTSVRHAAFSDADLEIMAVALAQPGAMQAMIHWYRAAFRYRPAKRVDVVEAPTLLIWAEDDVALGKPLTYGLEEWVPNLQIHYIPDCGHWVQNEAAEEVNEQMIVFLREASL